MSSLHDPHEVDLAVQFPSLPADRREEMRDFLDGYCEVALQVFERLKRERNASIDAAEDDS